MLISSRPLRHLPNLYDTFPTKLISSQPLWYLPNRYGTFPTILISSWLLWHLLNLYDTFFPTISVSVCQFPERYDIFPAIVKTSQSQLLHNVLLSTKRIAGRPNWRGACKITKRNPFPMLDRVWSLLLFFLSSKTQRDFLYLNKEISENLKSIWNGDFKSVIKSFKILINKILRKYKFSLVMLYEWMNTCSRSWFNPSS